VQTKGTVDHAPCYVREVVKRALQLGATALILCTTILGRPDRRGADIEMTREIARARRRGHHRPRSNHRAAANASLRAMG